MHMHEKTTRLGHMLEAEDGYREPVPAWTIGHCRLWLRASLVTVAQSYQVWKGDVLFLHYEVYEPDD